MVDSPICDSTRLDRAGELLALALGEPGGHLRRLLHDPLVAPLRPSASSSGTLGVSTNCWSWSVIAALVCPPTAGGGLLGDHLAEQADAPTSVVGEVGVDEQLLLQRAAGVVLDRPAA